jgi:hypothetical protein
VIYPPLCDQFGVRTSSPWQPVTMKTTGKVHLAYVIRHDSGPRCNCQMNDWSPWSYGLVCGGWRKPDQVETEKDAGVAFIVNCVRCRTEARALVAECDALVARLEGIRSAAVFWLGAVGGDASAEAAS